MYLCVCVCVCVCFEQVSTKFNVTFKNELFKALFFNPAPWSLLTCMF